MPLPEPPPTSTPVAASVTREVGRVRYAAVALVAAGATVYLEPARSAVTRTRDEGIPMETLDELAVGYVADGWSV